MPLLIFAEDYVKQTILTENVLSCKTGINHLKNTPWTQHWSVRTAWSVFSKAALRSNKIRPMQATRIRVKQNSLWNIFICVINCIISVYPILGLPYVLFFLEKERVYGHPIQYGRWSTTHPITSIQIVQSYWKFTILPNIYVKARDTFVTNRIATEFSKSVTLCRMLPL